MFWPKRSGAAPEERCQRKIPLKHAGSSQEVCRMGAGRGDVPAEPPVRVPGDAPEPPATFSSVKMFVIPLLRSGVGTFLVL